MQSSRQAWQTRNGFTLIETLLTVGIIAILAGATINAISPKKNLDESKDAVRRQDLNAMIDALYQYQIDHDGFPIIAGSDTLDLEYRDICSLTGSTNLFPCNFVAPPQRLPLGPLVPGYLPELPRDPEQPGNPAKCPLSFKADDCITGYQLWLDNDGRIHASAPLGNQKQGIELAR